MIDLFAMLAAPAQRALLSLGVNDVQDICKYTRYEIENLHGIGKNALRQIDLILVENNMNYMDEKQSDEVTEYISKYEGEIKNKLEEIRKLIRETIPKAKEKIAYQMPTYYYIENVVHFAGFTKHIGLFPTPSAIDKFEKELSAYKWSKGGIQFPVENKLPISLIKRITEYRMEEVLKS